MELASGKALRAQRAEGRSSGGASLMAMDGRNAENAGRIFRRVTFRASEK